MLCLLTVELSRVYRWLALFSDYFKTKMEVDWLTIDTAELKLSFSYLGRYPTKNIFTSHVCDAADDCGYGNRNNVQVPPPQFHFPHSGSASGSHCIKSAFTQHKRTQEPPRSLPRALARKGLCPFTAPACIRLISLKVHSPVVVVLEVK